MDVVSEFRDQVSQVAAVAASRVKIARSVSVSGGVSVQCSSVGIKVIAGQSTDIRWQLVTSVATDPAFNSQIHSADHLNPFPFGGLRRLLEGRVVC